LLPQLISAVPDSCPRRATLGALNTSQVGQCFHKASTTPGSNQEHEMKIRTKPAVFVGDRVTRDMLILAFQALIVGTAAAMLSALVVAAFVALL
jgi:hypothetical protein